MQHETMQEFTHLVYQQLLMPDGDTLAKSSSCPPQELLAKLFDILFVTSLKTEEGQPILCHVIWLDPNDPDPSPPIYPPHTRWNFIPLGNPLPLTVRNLTKLAKASDPRTSSFVVYPSENDELQIWGLVDQGNRWHEFLHYDSDSGPERPGLFQTSIVGIGHLTAYHSYTRLAVLRINEIVVESHDVLREGPIRDKLLPAISQHIAQVKEAVTAEVFDDRDHWPSSLQHDWIAALCRLLLRTQNYRHGGAFIITPDGSEDGLNIKYRINYDRLTNALHRSAVHTINEVYAADVIHSQSEDDAEYQIPIGLYLDETVEGSNRREAESEVDSALWFISLLTRVDGLVLLTPRLGVRGFGVEITVSDEPHDVRVATDASATRSLLRQIDYNHFGTRHRSMMRYCSKVSEAIGLVVSQDGDVRILTKLGEQVVMWENVQLRHELPRQQRSRRGEDL